VRPFLVSNSDGRSGTIAATPMLGVREMSGAMPAGADGDGASAGGKVDQAIAQLKGVLSLLDSIKAPPELAARVHEAIDAIEEYRSV
jgi:hypothetical protein